MLKWLFKKKNGTAAEIKHLKQSFSTYQEHPALFSSIFSYFLTPWKVRNASTIAPLRCFFLPPQRSSGGLILNCDINKQTKKSTWQENVNTLCKPRYKQFARWGEGWSALLCWWNRYQASAVIPRYKANALNQVQTRVFVWILCKSPRRAGAKRRESCCCSSPGSHSAPRVFSGWRVFIACTAPAPLWHRLSSLLGPN